MTTKENIFDLYAQAYESQKQHKMSLREYLEGCRGEPALYASTAERMMLAIGEPEFSELRPELREALTWYYKVDNLHNYDELKAACDFFSGFQQMRADAFGPIRRHRQCVRDKLADVLHMDRVMFDFRHQGTAAFARNVLGHGRGCHLQEARGAGAGKATAEDQFLG